MSIDSMTGFAREEGACEGFSWRWEVRSVNNRGLDVRVRAGPGMEGFELGARDIVAKRFKRGSFQIGLNMTEAPGLAGYRLNETLLEKVLAITEEVRARIGAPPARVEGLLRLRGILEPEEPADDDSARAAREAAMLESLSGALDKVAEARREEGARLAKVLVAFIDEIAALAGRARSLAAAQPEAMRARLLKQFAELGGDQAPVAEDRLAQEIALLIGKADVREEIDRLDAHVGQARDLIAKGGPVGRRLDFLAQEFNREANTLCSKAQDLELTRTGLDLKAAIEQFREQVQNIE